MATGLAHAAALVAAVAGAASGQLVDAQAPCVGYMVTGAGTVGVNGCYRPAPPPQRAHQWAAEASMYVLDGGHELYSWDGFWRLGKHGENMTYLAIYKTPTPPESEPGCGNVWSLGTDGDSPCPGVARTGLPPLPPTPPPPAPPPTAPPPPVRLIWEEEFDGPTLNTSRWNILEQVHRGGVYTKDNVAVVDGALQLRTIAQNLTIEQGGKNLSFYVSSGAVNTSGLVEQRLGRWEVRVKLPLVHASAGYTLHSSIWLFDNTADKARTGCPQEIDVVEQYTASTDTPVSRAAGNLHPFVGSPHRGGPPCSHRSFNVTSRSTVAVGDWTTNWTTFVVDWTEGWIAMRVNGKPYASFAVDGGFSDPLFLALTACVMDRVPPTEADKFPLYYLIDSVRVYEWV